jgi:outer membrane receptor protein involved in Fe transport
MNIKTALISILLPIGAVAQNDSIGQDVITINEVNVTTTQNKTMKSRTSALNTDKILSGELKRAACCNLGESFTTNPSVEVSYTDAATGSKQIKLLGLSGIYVQMMTENIPNFRGAAQPYGSGYVPGPWMHAISVSKGAGSVKNGYESVTGQINIEMEKPQNVQSVEANVYANHRGRLEGNLRGNIHLTDKLSTGLLLHAENDFAGHDENGDGFIDMARVRQYNAMNRWAWVGENDMFQAAIRYLDERRLSGQDQEHASHSADRLYTININTRRLDGFAKNAYTFDHESNSNVAVMASGSLHDQKSAYGDKVYNVYQKNLYLSLMFEREFGADHALSTGLSFNGDYYDQKYRLTHNPETELTNLYEKENVPGAYAQYTFNHDNRLILMGGVRVDHSSMYGTMFTPRFHGRLNIDRPLGDISWWKDMTFHATVGKGYRSPHQLVDNSYLLASSRRLETETSLRQEEAWNMGGGLSTTFDVGSGDLELSAEYYYARFIHQFVIDMDTDPTVARLMMNRGKSFSHTAQVEMKYTIGHDFSALAAYRYTDVRENHGSGLVQKALTSKSKGLFTFSYTPMMAIWQFDLTLALNGGGRMPTPRLAADGTPMWSERYHMFPTLNAQIKRDFRHFSIYIGGENLTGYKQKRPIIGADDPWGDTFDATMVYAPIHGAIVYAGFTYTFKKY